MGFLAKLLGRESTKEPARAAAQPAPQRPEATGPIRLARRSKPWEVDTEDGSQIIGTGYHMIDDGSGRYVRHDDPALAREGVLVTRVTGTTHTGDVLQRADFLPGRGVSLVPDPDNEYDRHALGVWDVERAERVGWVPKGDAPGLSEELQAGTQRKAIVLSQFHNANGKRCGIRLLIGPPDTVDRMMARARPFKG